MPGPELLPVEVGRVHHVIVDEQEMLHAAAGQHQDGIGAQTARTGHAHPGGTQGLQLGRGKIARQALTQHVLTHGMFHKKGCRCGDGAPAAPRSGHAGSVTKVLPGSRYEKKERLSGGKALLPVKRV